MADHCGHSERLQAHVVSGRLCCLRLAQTKKMVLVDSTLCDSCNRWASVSRRTRMRPPGSTPAG